MILHISCIESECFVYSPGEIVKIVSTLVLVNWSACVPTLLISPLCASKFCISVPFAPISIVFHF